MEGNQQRGQFLHKEGEDRRRAVEEIKLKIESGLFSSDKVIKDIVEKIGPHFASMGVE